MWQRTEIVRVKSPTSKFANLFVVIQTSALELYTPGAEIGSICLYATNAHCVFGRHQAFREHFWHQPKVSWQNLKCHELNCPLVETIATI